MIALLATELRRMISRRLVKFVGLFVLAAIIVGAVITFFNSSPDSEAVTGEMRTEQRRALAACQRGEFDLPGQDRKGFELDRACERLIARDLRVSDPGWPYTDLQDVFLGSGPLLAILSLVLGASFIGADWQKGMITTTLTWEPRRVRLLAVKFVVVALTGFVFCVLTQLALAGALWPVATFRGSTAGLDATWLRATTGFALRIAFVCGLTAVVGCAIATVGRNTTAALGVAFVYFAVLEGLIRGFRPSWQPWLLGDNAAQFIANEPAGLAMADKTTADVTIVLLAYATVGIAIATVFFSRRDVT